jgi:cob(I)alamin adenosyltransferase
MVVLNKIHTCTGDDGTTAVGTRFDVQHLRGVIKCFSKCGSCQS